MQNIISILNRYMSHINMPSVNIIDVIEILLISIFVYEFMVWIKYTRAYTLLKGLLIIGAFLIIAYIFKMNTILWIVSKMAGAMLTAVIVIFQPELRKVVEQLGQKKIISTILPFDMGGKEVKERFTDKTINELIKACFDMGEVKTGALIVIEQIISTILPFDMGGKEVKERFTDKTINELIKACFDMGEVKTGALIVIEQKNLLDEYIRTGINIDAVLSSQLLINIFEHNTPLHDGAVVMRGNRIVAATCYLPLSDNMELSKQLGTRHRAGVGIRARL